MSTEDSIFLTMLTVSLMVFLPKLTDNNVDSIFLTMLTVSETKLFLKLTD